MLLPGVPSKQSYDCSSSPRKGVYNPKAFIPHAASLGQACAHCRRFPTAASRRSQGRVSVPMWGAVLSDPLPVIALVGHYPTNKLIGHSPLPTRHEAFKLLPLITSASALVILSGISSRFQEFSLA